MAENTTQDVSRIDVKTEEGSATYEVGSSCQENIEVEEIDATRSGFLVRGSEEDETDLFIPTDKVFRAFVDQKDGE